MSESYDFTTRTLVDNGTNYFRGTLSQMLQDLRDRYVNSEGLSNVSNIPSDLAVFASSVYQRFFTVYNALQPNSVSQQNQSVTTWPDLARLIGEIDSLESSLKDYSYDSWFLPISTMMLIDPPGTREDADSWLNRMLRNEETADLALKAQGYLSTYKRVIRINIKSGTGSCSNEFPLAEPGLKALQSGTTDVYSKLRKSLPLSDLFNNYIEEFMDLMDRISPTLAIVTGDSILMERSVKQMFPLSWYNFQTTITGATTNARITGLNSMVFVLNSISAQSYSTAFKIQSRSNLVISPGMKYFLNIALTSQVILGMVATAVLTVTAGTETQITTVPIVVQRLGPNSVISIPLTVTTGNNGPELNYTFTWSSLNAMTAGQELHVATESSIAVCYPLFEQLSTALISRKQATTYESVQDGATWFQFYGTQYISDGMIDPDLSLSGYIDNYTTNEFASKVIVEILQKLHLDGTFKMRVISEGDSAFDVNYQGEEGMSLLLKDLTERGVACFLSKFHVFNNGGNPVSKAAMIKVFERFSQLLRTIQALYNYGNSATVSTVQSIIDPGY